jgi:hypothetical protein
VKTLDALGCASSKEYRAAFGAALAANVQAGYILPEDAAAMRRRAALCPSLTFTETYRDDYEAFTAIVFCRG